MVLASASTGLWVAIGLLIAIKMPLIAWLLFMPFRSDRDDVEIDEDEAGEGDGGGGVVSEPSGPPNEPDRPGGGPRLHPSFPHHARRGEHDSDPPASPERVRIGHGERLRPSRRD